MMDEHAPATDDVGDPSAVRSLVLSLVPYVAEGAADRVRDAARDLGLLGVVVAPPEPAAPVDVHVAAAAREVLHAVVDGRLATRTVQDVVDALRMRCVASVACLDPAAMDEDELVIAESLMPAALDRAQADFEQGEPPLVVAAIGAGVPDDVTPAELSMAFRAEVVDAVADGRTIVMGRPVGDVVWAPALRPVVGLAHSGSRTIAAIWTRHAVRRLQSPIAREQAMLEPDVLLEWIAEPDRLAPADAPSEALALERAVVALVAPQVGHDARDRLRPALEEIGAAEHVDALLALAATPRAEDTLERVVAALSLPSTVLEVLIEEVHPTAVPGARRTTFEGLLPAMRDGMRQAIAFESRGVLTTARAELEHIRESELGEERVEIDRRRRHWFAAIVSLPLAAGNAAVALGAIPTELGGDGPSPWFWLPAVGFAIVGAVRIAGLVRDARRERDAGSDDGR